MIEYFYQIFKAVSILINTLIGGKANQTFSARNWQRKKEGKLNVVYFIDKLCYLDKDHCMHCWVYWKVKQDIHKTPEFEERMYYERYEQDYFN